MRGAKRASVRAVEKEMTLGAFLSAWGNAPFEIVFGIALVFAGLSWSGALSVFAGESDGDGDGDGDDGDGGDDGDDADDGDGDDADGARGAASHVLGALGFGRLPLSLLWQSFAIVFGVTGVAVNTRYLHEGALPLRSWLVSVPVALLVAFAVVALLARYLGPVLAADTSLASSRDELVGHVGTVISTSVTGEFGEVRFREKNGHDVRLVCSLDEGSRVALEGEKVVVVGLEPRTRRPLVTPLEPTPDEPLPPP
jgi:membrane protein implicated in regulation of membrane protease activity